MNISSTELSSDIRYIKQFNMLYLQIFSTALCLLTNLVVFLISELFETLFNIAAIVASIQASIYNYVDCSSIICSIT